MTRAVLAVVVVGVAALVSVKVQAAKPAQPIPASAVFGVVDGFSGDGLGAYIDGASECVGSSYSASSGDYTFRTASHLTFAGYNCEANQGPWPRKVALDLSQQVVATSSVDCANGVVPSGLSIDVCRSTLLSDMRLAPPALFRSGTTSTQGTVYISQHPELNDTEFVLTYRQPLTVTASGPARILSCNVATVQCDADLHRAVKQVNQKGAVVGYTLVFLGVWHVPIQMTVTPTP